MGVIASSHHSEQKKFVIYKDEGKYIGSIQNNNRDGFGYYFYPEGGYYEGNWKNNNKCGFGCMFYKNGEMYSGGWFDNKKHGKGNFYSNNGDRYHGVWENNEKNGEFVIEIGSMRIDNIILKYIGKYEKNKKTGVWQIFKKDELLVEEHWNNNEPIEKCLIRTNENKQDIKKYIGMQMSKTNKKKRKKCKKFEWSRTRKEKFEYSKWLKFGRPEKRLINSKTKKS